MADIIPDPRDLPHEVRRTSSLIRRLLRASAAGDFPRLVAVTGSSPDYPAHSVDFVFEIGPDMMMLANFYSPLEDHKPIGHEKRVADRIHENAVRASGVASQIRSALDHVSDFAKKLVANARSRGLPVQLISTHVAEYGRWTEPHDAQFLVTIETLGQNLRCSTLPLLVENIESLARMFETRMDALEWRVAERDRLRGMHADGLIDLIALNVMTGMGDPMPILRSMMDRHAMILSQGLQLIWQDGGIISRMERLPEFEWTDNRLTIYDLALPATVCAEAVNRPVTDLVSHSALTNDILVRSVANHPDGQSVSVVLEVPVFLFNVELGRIWAVPD